MESGSHELGLPAFSLRLQLEGVLKPELHLPAAGDGLGKIAKGRQGRVENNVLPTGVQHAWGIREQVWMIEGIEELGAECQPVAFMELESACYARVIEPLTRADEGIAAESSVRRPRDNEMEAGGRRRNASRAPAQASLIRKEGARCCGDPKLEAVNSNGRKRRARVAEARAVIAAVGVTVEVEAILDGFRAARLRGDRLHLQALDSKESWKVPCNLPRVGACFDSAHWTARA